MGRRPGKAPSPGLRRALAERRANDWTLRAIAERAGVSHFVIVKMSRGERVEAKSLRKVQDWLFGARESQTIEDLRGFLTHGVPKLSVRQRGRLEVAVARAVEDACRDAEVPAPGWVARLTNRKGRNSRVLR